MLSSCIKLLGLISYLDLKKEILTLNRLISMKLTQMNMICPKSREHLRGVIGFCIEEVIWS